MLSNEGKRVWESLALVAPILTAVDAIDYYDDTRKNGSAQAADDRFDEAVIYAANLYREGHSSSAVENAGLWMEAPSKKLIHLKIIAEARRQANLPPTRIV